MVKNNDSREKHLRNTVRRLRTGGETEKKFAKVLSGEKANEVLGFVTADAAKNLNVPRKTKITINRNDLLHMDNSGHFSGKGFGKKGHDDARPLSNADISNLKKIIASAQKHEISPTQSRSGMHLLRIVRKINKNHLVLVRVQKQKHEISLFDAYNITNKKFAEIKKESATHLAYAERPPIHEVNILQGKEKINRLIANTISHTPPKKWLTAAPVGNDGHFLRNSIISPTNNKGYATSKNVIAGFKSEKDPKAIHQRVKGSRSFSVSIISPTNNKINQIFASSPAKTKVAPVPPTFKPRTRTKSYWARRSEQRMNEALKYSTSQQKLITRAYTAAQRNLTREVKSLYKNAYKNDQTFDQTKLREIVPNGEISRFKTEMKKAGLKTNLPENYRARANRLEFLQAQIRGELQKVAQKENQISAKIHSETLQNSYYKTIFHTAQGFGATPVGNSRNFAEIPELPRKLYKKVYGANYDAKTWKLRESSGLSGEEKAALQPLIQSEKVKKIYRVREVDKPQKIRTPDLFIDNKMAEIKSISSKRSIENQIKSAGKQIRKNGMLILDSTKSKLSDEEIAKEIARHAYRRNFSEFSISKNAQLLEHATKQNISPSSAAYAGHEGGLYKSTVNDKEYFVKKNAKGNLFVEVKNEKSPGTIRQRAKDPESLSAKIIPKDKLNVNQMFGLNGAKTSENSAQTQPNSAFSALDKRTINQILTAKFEGKNYSERIWKNTETLAKQLQEILLKNVATGASYEKTARQIRERFKVGKFYAERLVRTETAHFENLGEIESYKEMGIEKFQFLATLDKRTSLFCQETDGKIFKVSEAQPGENVPPLHPNCRSTIVPVFSENFAKNEFRIARNEKGKNIYIDAKTKYTDWAKMFEVKNLTAPAPVFAPVISKTFGAKIPDGVSGYNPNLAENYNKILSEPVGDNFFERLSEKDVNNPYDIPLTRAEIGTYKRLESLGYRIDPIATDRIPKPDFKLFGKQWELKNPIIHENKTPGRLITNTIWKATDKGKLNIWIDATNLNMGLNTIIQQAINHMENIHNGNLVEHLIIQRGKKIIQLK